MYHILSPYPDHQTDPNSKAVILERRKEIISFKITTTF